MKKWVRATLYATICLAIFWTALTFWVEIAGKQQVVQKIAENERAKALILYNPDPIYNLDEQVCSAFAKGLQKIGVSSTIVTNKNITQIKDESFDLYVFCTNTYNFAPDQGIIKAIDQLKNLEGQPVVAITLGSGSTNRSKRKFEEYLNDKSVALIHSKTLWLMRPNDESRINEPNTKVAADYALNLALTLSKEPFLEKH